MSFILDALKRSENERQEQAEAEFATVPSASDSPATPRWLWALGALLAINAVVLAAVMFRPDSPPAIPVTSGANVTQNVAPANTPSSSFDDQVAEARRNQVALETRQPERSNESVPQPTPPQRDAVSVSNLRNSRAAILPTLTELRVDGTLQLPELHIDIHVYSDQPSERFVFINMDKYQEGSQLSDGPVVQEITSDGVILDYQNTTFILPRE